MKNMTPPPAIDLRHLPGDRWGFMNPSISVMLTRGTSFYCPPPSHPIPLISFRGFLYFWVGSPEVQTD